MSSSHKRVAVVLFNLGGPDSPEAVRPFLQNLFSDPAIIRAPSFVRWFLARIISRAREPEAKKIYAHLGGRSPILPQTHNQADSLKAELNRRMEGMDFRTFVVMRYWHPRAVQVAKDIAGFDPDTVVCMPLYPQFSTTTTASSISEFKKALQSAGVNARTVGPCCYPVQPGFVSAYSDLIRKGLKKVKPGQTPRVLFSAHGLPERIVAAGDPYAHQVERSASAIAEAVGSDMPEWRVTYQSRVGPLKWIGPSTDDEIEEASKAGLVPVVCPLAFVSEHSETLVELDVEYREMAEGFGAPDYIRIPTVSVHPEFIAGLADITANCSFNP